MIDDSLSFSPMEPYDVPAVSRTSIQLKGSMDEKHTALLTDTIEVLAPTLETLEYPPMADGMCDSSILQRMPNLRTLSLPAGATTGNVDRRALSNLTSLEIQQDSCFTAPELRTYVSLTSLSLVWYADKLDLSVLVDLPLLSQLDLTGFNAAKDEHVAPLTNLVSLAIQPNRNLTNAALIPLVNLRYLNIGQSEITEEALVNMKKLRALFIWNNKHIFKSDAPYASIESVKLIVASKEQEVLLPRQDGITYEFGDGLMQQCTFEGFFTRMEKYFA